MIFEKNMYYQTLFVISCFVLSDAEEYQNSFLELLNRNSDSVFDVTSASVLIQPSIFTNQYSRESKIPYAYRRYAFKPRAIPLRDEPQVESSKYYQDALNKTDLLFPGNYLPIVKENSDDQFHTKEIPLIRSDEYQKRSLDVDEPIIEKPEDFSEESPSRRSLSYIFGVDGNDDDDDYEEYEEEDIKDEERKKGGYTTGLKFKKKKQKKLKKYMLPLLLAYKMKYFALVPTLIAGLVLLVGATGIAGFFFALFAAAMGLQKGNY